MVVIGTLTTNVKLLSEQTGQASRAICILLCFYRIWIYIKLKDLTAVYDYDRMTDRQTCIKHISCFLVSNHTYVAGVVNPALLC